MAVSRTTRGYIEKGDFDSLEDEWLGRAADDLADLDYFVGTARALAGNGEEERARMLLELIDDPIRERGRWPLRLELLRRAGHLLFDGDGIHPAIVDSLSEIYRDQPSFTGLAEEVGLHRAVHDLPKIWDKVDRLRELMRFEVGTVVRMEGHGAGRVTETNFALSAFRVEFESHGTLSVGFKAAAKLLEPLPEGHFLRRRMEAPEALAELDPPRLLEALLTSYERPLTAGEVRERLSGLVDEAGWTSWWAAARRHPQVVASRGGRQTYHWAESSDHAVESVLASFDAAAPREKIALLRRESARDAELGQRMAAALATAGAAAADDDPALAFEIWHALEREDAAPADDADWSPARLVDRLGSLKKLLTGIEDRPLRERAYRLVRERRDDWREVFLAMLPLEEESRPLELLAGELRAAAEPRFERFLDGTLAQPHRTPAAFAWLAERAADDEALRTRNPLRLLQQIFAGLSRDELAPYRMRLKKLLASGGTVPRLFPHLEPDQAAAAGEAVRRAAGLEDYERDALVAALEARFPALRGEPEAATTALYATRESIAAKRAELDQITRVELPANRKAIEEARALGDLRENFEYKSARQRHEYLSALATKLNRDLGRAQPIDFERIDPSQVRVGTRVRLRDGDGERTLTVLGPWESAPESGIVSYESELAGALLGKAVGDSAELAGGQTEIVAIERAR